MTRIQGAHVMLREFQWEDLPAMRAWITDPRTTRYLSGVFARPQTYEQTERFLRDILEGNSGGVHYVIANAQDLSYLGQCDLMMIDTLARKAEMALVITEEQTGKGYGYEATNLLLEYAFQTQNLHRVYLWVYADNARAVRLYKRLGFVEEGVARDHAFIEGHYVDWKLMGILREDWEKARSK